MAMVIQTRTRTGADILLLVASLGVLSIPAQHVGWGWFRGLGAVSVCALTAWLFHRTARQLRPDGHGALAATLLLIFGTSLWDATRWDVVEPLAMLCLLACVNGLWHAKKTGRRAPLVGAGVAWAVLAAIRPEIQLLVPIPLAYLLIGDSQHKKSNETYRAAGAFLLAPVVALPLIWALNGFDAGQAFGFGPPGTSATDSPLLSGLTALITSPMHGIVYFAPAAVVGLFGLPCLIRRERRFGLLLVAVAAGMTVLYAKTSWFSAGAAVGPHLLLPALPLMLLPMALLLDRNSLGNWGAAAVGMISVAGIGLQTLAVVGDPVVRTVRHGLFFGPKSQFEAAVRFLHSPFAEYLHQIRTGHANLLWLDSVRAGLPGIAWLVPVIALILFVLAWVRLIPRISPTSTPGCVIGQATTLERVTLIGCALVLAGACALVAVERIGNPRGLELALYDTGPAVEPRQVLSGQRPQVDRFANPLDSTSLQVRRAQWHGYLRNPSYYFTNHMHLAAQGHASVWIDGKEILTSALQPPGRIHRLTERTTFRKGYYPILVTYEPGDDNPYLSLRWTIQDFAFRSVIDERYLFSRKPGALAGVLIELEFYFMAAAVLALYVMIATALTIRRRLNKAGAAAGTGP